MWLLLSWLIASAAALSPSDQLRLDLIGGETIEGWFYRSDEQTLELTAAGRRHVVALDLVTQAWCNGDPLTLEQLFEEARASLEENVVDPTLATPSPVLVGGLSLLFGGTGHAVLGSWQDARRYAVVEVVLLSLAAYEIWGRTNPGGAIPFLALDVVFRGYAATEAASQARWRRRSREEGQQAAGVEPSSS